MRACIGKTVPFVCVWVIPVVLLLVNLPNNKITDSDLNLNTTAKNTTATNFTATKSTTPLSGVDEGVGVSLLFMGIPTIMSLATLPLPCDVTKTFQNMEVYLVIILCIMRASAGIVMYRNGAEQNIQFLAFSTVQLYTFMMLKSIHKIRLFSNMGYIITYVAMVAVPIYVICLDLFQTEHELYQMSYHLQLMTLAVVMVTEWMYATHVEKQDLPNKLMMVSQFLMIGSTITHTLVKESVHALIESGLYACAFSFYYLGYRLQEKQYLRDIASFEEVPTTEMDKVFKADGDVL